MFLSQNCQDGGLGLHFNPFLFITRTLLRYTGEGMKKAETALRRHSPFRRFRLSFSPPYMGRASEGGRPLSLPPAVERYGTQATSPH